MTGQPFSTCVDPPFPAKWAIINRSMSYLRSTRSSCRICSGGKLPNMVEAGETSEVCRTQGDVVASSAMLGVGCRAL